MILTHTEALEEIESLINRAYLRIQKDSAILDKAYDLLAGLDPYEMTETGNQDVAEIKRIVHMANIQLTRAIQHIRLIEQITEDKTGIEIIC